MKQLTAFLIITKGEFKMSLIAHTDTMAVTKEIVMAVPEPEFTKSWHPLQHAKILTALEGACEQHNLGVMDERYSMSGNGSKMFGVWNLYYNQSDERCYSIGFRNSIDKSMGLGVVAGNKVFVCDNMCFNGEFITFRRHTSGFDVDELSIIAGEAVGQAIEQITALNEWQDNLKTYTLDNGKHKQLTYDFMKAGVLPCSHFHTFNDCLEQEQDLEGKTNLYAMHGAVTRLVKDKSLFHISDTSKKLNLACDEWMNNAA